MKNRHIPKTLEDFLDTSVKDYLPVLQSRILTNTHYFGIQTYRNPLDFWVYQEIISEMKPDVIIEIGTFRGGGTLAYAHLLDLLDHGYVVTIDPDQKKVSDVVRNHPRIQMIEKTAVESFDELRSSIGGQERVLVIEDSSHTFDNTLAVLRLFSQFILPGGYFVVEDGICHHGLDIGPTPGPLEAIEAFLKENADFEVDREKESFVITWNPKGFLRKKGKG